MSTSTQKIVTVSRSANLSQLMMCIIMTTKLWHCNCISDVYNHTWPWNCQIFPLSWCTNTWQITHNWSTMYHTYHWLNNWIHSNLPNKQTTTLVKSSNCPCCAWPCSSIFHLCKTILWCQIQDKCDTPNATGTSITKSSCKNQWTKGHCQFERLLLKLQKLTITCGLQKSSGLSNSEKLYKYFIHCLCPT